ncbi:exopolyphosphatase [Arsukibacterium sp.]|uniref:Ppx/GppA phosphatase family protein n=1 Tax=Arsukibacterium sp. TaxID=1977258 RepID=UPI00262BAD4F|nr:exopolyphosphatase [Arsukibacterium sp.]
MTDPEQTASSNADYMAAVDLGSNSFHMVIARVIDGSLQLLHREKQKVQLAEGLNDELVLSEEAIERGLQVLAQFADTLQPFAPNAVRVIATYTLRRARNSATFLRRAKVVFPFPIEVISGQEEARFIYQGVAHFEHFSAKRLVIDIGGGSTEFAIGEGLQPLRLSSRNMGCVSYGQSHFAQGKISPRRFERAILQAEQELEPIVSSFRNAGWQQAVGTSGTIKTIKDVISGLGWNNSSLRLNDLTALKRHLLQYNHASELELTGLTDDRKLLLCPGLAILIAAFNMLQIDEMVYVDAALREGVLYEMSERLQHHDIREHTISSMMRRYTVDEAQTQRVQQTAEALFNQVQAAWQLTDDDGLLLSFACRVFEIGLHINSSGIQKHSAYILQNANLPGFNQEQQQLLACLVRFHRRKIRADELPIFSLYQLPQVINLLVLLRLAVLLNQKRRDDFVPEFTVSASAQQLQLVLPPEWLAQQSVLSADLQQEQKALKKIAFRLDCPNLPETVVY